MRDHTDAEMFGPETTHGRTGSGATLSLVPALVPAHGEPVPDAPGVDDGVSARPGHRPARRRASGPRPVRPAATAGRQAPGCRTVSRPAERAWPEQRSGAHERVLVRAPQRASEPLAWKFRVRRAVAGLVALLVTAAVVVGLGLLADAASAARHAPAGHEQTVTVGSLTPVWTGPAQEQGVLVR
ncbi:MULTISPECIES: hypothetical protein [unclassified Pseudonocardia]|uniref:hypothetical protein n=1 Tax=unclassified Pseudonocardia TaxID=2619320 RepID=UPI00095B4AAC|nr:MULTISPECIES: hypothetical protein [unclassified Pseudonocardia]MBN9099424.1 hypothetical protein [Pseudonocardia sp.]OJY48610.1 MAG: hypothetical protein BGP03_04910 [Pseudonocardia sp. 73-21]